MALVVEHDPWIRLVLCDVVAQAGFRVVKASNGFSALRLARREPLALVVLDLVLPEQSGLSVLAELRAAPATAHVPVIVIGGHPQVLREAVTQADAVIAELFATDTLLAEVSGRRRRTVRAAAYCDSCHTCAEGDRAVKSRRGS
jgi:DNA-binding response OmpR family regulator